MPLYSYAKRKVYLTKKIISVLSILFMVIGIGILSWTLYPIISYELVYGQKFNELVRPAPVDFIRQTIVAKIPQVLGIENSDFTKASVWFPRALNIKLTSNTASVNSYTLDVPKVGIMEADVKVGSDDLSKSLIHFTGPLPGNFGNPVIFGHSTLLWFYDPKNYKSIFSKLPELDIDDDIFVHLDNITYRYKVYEMKVVSPETVSVLDQDYTQATITLVTCVPPGTYFKRLIVRGKLVTL